LALFRSLSKLFVVGMVGGAGALMMLPLAGEVRPVVAHVRIPDPPAVPCKRQSWPNADRGCLKWTAPRAIAQKDDERARAGVTARVAAFAGAAIPKVAAVPPARGLAPDSMDEVRATVVAVQPVSEPRKHIVPEDGPTRGQQPAQPVVAPPAFATLPAASGPEFAASTAETPGVTVLTADVAFAAPATEPPRFMPAVTSVNALAAAMAEARRFAPPPRKIAAAASLLEKSDYAVRR
jgi:hypothetical protein